MESSEASLGAESNESVSFHSNVISDSSLGLSNDDLVMSGRTEEFMSFIEKDSKNPKKKIIENKELLHEIELLKASDNNEKKCFYAFIAPILSTIYITKCFKIIDFII